MDLGDREGLNQLSEEVIGAAYRVSNTLGCGYLEKVYENALAVELRNRGRRIVQQAAMTVLYGGQVVGEYYADLLVEHSLVVELKAVRSLDSIHEAQCLNYLRASRLRLCLLMNFARPRVDVRRIVNVF